MSLEKVDNLLDQVREEIATLQSNKLKNDPISLDKFGDYVRDYRKSHNYNQEYFADICGVSKNIIVNIEKSRTSVTLQNLLKVTNSIGVRICLI